MFEYGNLKYIKDDDKEINGWYFTAKDGNKYIEKDLGEDFYLEILNKLGEEGWELVSIDVTLGFVLKRKLKVIFILKYLLK